MKNVADAIESFIVSQLVAASHNGVMVQRNELADKLSCAPSQISYVLSTRFTPAKGYLVESRRGSGGFIRIVRLVPQKVPVEPVQEQPEQQEEPTVIQLLDYWKENRMLTRREHALLSYMMNILDEPEPKKKQILQGAISKMVARE